MAAASEGSTHIIIFHLYFPTIFMASRPAL